MQEKYLLYLTEDGGALYKEPSQKLFDFEGKFEAQHIRVQDLLVRTPHIPLRLLIDNRHQEIREEKLPSLYFWDRLSFLFHKRREWSNEGGFSGAHFLKENKNMYLRYVHIPSSSPLMTWILWTQALPNPFHGVFFVPLEAGQFLKRHLSSAQDYQMLIYPGHLSEKRYVIFKKSRLLLFRVSQGDEDLRPSLHFLSRTYPDIHEKLHILSLIKETPGPLGLDSTRVTFEEFLHFLSSIKRPSLALNLKPQNILWIRRVGCVGLLGIFLLVGVHVYQGVKDKNRALSFLLETKRLKDQERHLLSQNLKKDVHSLRRALDNYAYIKTQTISPLKTIGQLFRLVENREIRLLSLKWHHEKKLEILISFYMKEMIPKRLAERFEEFLMSCGKVFPKGKITVMEAPFNSSSHEIFKYPTDATLPKATIKIVLP